MRLKMETVDSELEVKYHDRERMSLKLIQKMSYTPLLFFPLYCVEVYYL